jgi:hypothetical protein
MCYKPLDRLSGLVLQCYLFLPENWRRNGPEGKANYLDVERGERRNVKCITFKLKTFGPF